jgi:hypothetical protein
VDSATSKNLVVWEQPTGTPVDSFIIYRETNQAGVYAQIGAQINTAFSTFIDTGSYPATQANRYKIGYRDTCGSISSQSTYHKTVHLSINQGSGNSWNLIWDAYEGFTFASYNIYRGTSPQTMSLLTSIASNLYQYTDFTPTTPVYYAIEVDNPNGCNPSARMANNYSSSISNIVNPSSTGIVGIHSSQYIFIYPNPASTILNIHSQLSTLNSQLIITDLLGNEIYKETLSGIDKIISISTWSEGIYFYEIRGQEGSTRGKFVIQK